jgi:hypothetical protein
VPRLRGALLVACAALAVGSDGNASISDWIRIAVRGGACARGRGYAFWLHRGSSKHLLLYFQDGGGCWSYETCAPGSGYFQDNLRSPTDPRLPESGILDFHDRRNPFRTFSAVYIPYCTGDVHWGNNVQRYSDGHGNALTIHHVGFANDRRVLGWTYRRFHAPRQVFVTGCSAGSVGSAVWAPYVMRHYPRAQVNQLGDSLAFVFPRAVDIRSGWRADRNLPAWIPRMSTLDPTALTMARYYSIVASYYRRHVFSQFAYARDAVQTRYYVALGGRAEDFPSALAQSLAEIRRAATNFHSYVAPGDSHCVLPLSRFYDTSVGGVPLRRWVAAVAGGRAVRSVPAVRSG